MSSSDSADVLDLERDLPTTVEDVVALSRLRHHPRMELDAYFRFLSSFPPATVEALTARRGPRGPEPFTLPESP